MLAWIIGALVLAQSSITTIASGAIEGRIFASDGTPMAHTRVSAIEVTQDFQNKPDTATQFRIVQTDMDGQYRIDNLPAGRYYIAAGLVASPTYYPGVTTVRGAEPLSLQNGSTLRNINFAFLPETGFSVSGKVLGISPSLPYPLRLRLYPVANPSSPMSQTVAVDVNGSFQFPRLPPGDYELAVVQTNPSSKPLLVEIRSADVTNLQIQAPLMSVGRVVVDDGRPLPFAGATGPNPQDVATLISLNPGGAVRANGGFGGNSIVPGEFYRLTITGIPFGYYVKSMVTGTVDLLSQPLKLVGPVSPEILVTLTTSRPASEAAGATVHGRIIGSLTQSPGGFPTIVTLSIPRAQGSHAGEAVVQTDGTFEFKDVPPGTYQLRVASSGKSLANTTLAVGNSDIGNLEIDLNSNSVK